MLKLCKTLICLFLFSALMGCQTAPTKSFKSKSQIYNYSFEDVWRALMQSMSKYPMLSVNIEDAKIETQPISLNEIWKPAHANSRTSTSKKYKLHISLIEGRIGKRNSVKIVVKKKISYKKNFFAQEKSLLSDGLEEEIILYRVKRELLAFKRLQKVK